MADDLTCAIHECGHACVYLLAGPDWARIIELSIDGNSGGVCHVRYRKQFPQALMAGLVAEKRHAFGKGWRPKPAAFTAALADGIEDVITASRLMDSTDPARLLGLWDETRPLIEHCWPRIELLAGVLAKARVMTGAQVEHLWRSAREPEPIEVHWDGAAPEPERTAV